jgi:hypothetical protein
LSMGCAFRVERIFERMFERNGELLRNIPRFSGRDELDRRRYTAREQVRPAEGCGQRTDAIRDRCGRKTDAAGNQKWLESECGQRIGAAREVMRLQIRLGMEWRK